MDLTVVDQTQIDTQSAIDKILEERNHGPKALSEPLYVEYTPRDGGPVKMLKIVDIRNDPLEPPRHKQISVPEVPDNLIVPILKRDYELTVQETQEWKVPRVQSAWKNPDYRMAKLEDRIANDPRSRRKIPKLGKKIFDLVGALDAAENEVRATQELEELQKVAETQKNDYLERQSEQYDSRLYAKARPATTGPYDGPLFADQAVREMYVPKGEKEIEFEKDEGL